MGKEKPIRLAQKEFSECEGLMPWMAQEEWGTNGHQESSTYL